MKTPRGRVAPGRLEHRRRADYFFFVVVFLAELFEPDLDALLEAPFFAAAIEVPLMLCPLR